MTNIIEHKIQPIINKLSDQLIYLGLSTINSFNQVKPKLGFNRPVHG